MITKQAWEYNKGMTGLRRRIIVVSMVVLFAVLIVYSVLAGFFYVLTVGQDRRRGDSRFDPPAAGRLKREDFTIESHQGYTLAGSWFLTNRRPERIIVLVHGLGADRWDLLEMSGIYTALGFSVITYDSRNHGESGGRKTTFGFYEHRDLEGIIDFAAARFPGARMGVHGKSMGGAAALLYAESARGIDFFVIDAAFSDLKELLRIRLRDDYHLPNLGFIELTGAFARIGAGFEFRQVSPIASVAKVHTPILFIHGADDRFVPTFMSEKLFRAKPGEKDLHLIPGAGHADTFYTNPEGYTRAVHTFLREKVPALGI